MDRRHAYGRRKNKSKNMLKVATLVTCLCLCVVLAVALLKLNQDDENKNPVEASTKPTFDIVENQTGSSEQATQEGSEAPTHGGNEDPTQGQTQPPTQGQTQAPTQGQTQPPTQGGSETPTQPVINAPVIYESELGPDGFVQLMQYARPPQANEPLADPNFYKDCLFIGDSVTYGLISYSSKSLSGAFSTNNVNAATSRFMTRYESYYNSLLGKNPKMIFLLFGCNDLNVSNPNYDYLVQTYIKFVKRLQTDYPNAKVIVQITFPISPKYSQNTNVAITNDKVMEFGNRLKKELTKNKIYYIDIRNSMQNEYGYLKTEISNDGLHFKWNYYPFWMNIVKEVIELNQSKGILE
ncbi:MAG: hypothetical protein E7252_04465 [Lachnospira sp.]|nr:hypothetical protein [Lachnospira sp.]